MSLDARLTANLSRSMLAPLDVLLSCDWLNAGIAAAVSVKAARRVYMLRSRMFPILFPPEGVRKFPWPADPRAHRVPREARSDTDSARRDRHATGLRRNA